MAQTPLPDREIVSSLETWPADDERETLHIDFLIDHSLHSDYRTVKNDSEVIFLEKLLGTDAEVLKCLHESASNQPYHSITSNRAIANYIINGALTICLCPVWLGRD
jgi:hypothetical protein